MAKIKSEGELMVDRLRAICKSGGITQYRLAKTIGVECSTVNRWLAGTSTPRGVLLTFLKQSKAILDLEKKAKL